MHPFSVDTLSSEKYFSEFFFFLRIHSRLIEYGYERPVVMEADITREIEELIEAHIEYTDLLTRIWRYLLYIPHITSDVEIRMSRDIARAIEYMPERPIITHVSCLFEEFSLCACERIFIWRIERSPRKSEK